MSKQRKINTRHVPRVPLEELEGMPQLAAYLTRLHEDSFRKVQTHQISLSATNTGTVAGGDSLVLTLGAKGVTPDDHVSVRPIPGGSGTMTGKLFIGESWCSATDVVKVKFANIGSTATTVAKLKYKVIATRV